MRVGTPCRFTWLKQAGARPSVAAISNPLVGPMIQAATPPMPPRMISALSTGVTLAGDDCLEK